MGQSMAEVYKNLSDDVKQLNPELFGPLGIDAHRQLDEALRPKRGNKYGARKTKVDGHTFDSAKESRRYLELKRQQDAGEIADLILQCEIILLEGFTYQEQKVKSIKYTADFVYVKEGKTYIEDVKSVATSRTEAFRIRWRLLQWMYKDMPEVILLLT